MVDWMAVSSALIYWVLFLMILGVIVTWVLMVQLRKRKAFRLVVVKDWRNPSQKFKVYWAMWNNEKSKEFLNLYKTLWSPLKTTINPPFQMDAYVYEGKTIYCYRGASGNPDENMLVPIHMPIVSQAGAREFYKELSAAIMRTLHIADKTFGLDVDDIVDYSDKGSRISIAGGRISSITSEGVGIEYLKPLDVGDQVGLARKNGEIRGIVSKRNKKVLEVTYTVIDSATGHETEKLVSYQGDEIAKLEKLNTMAQKLTWLVRGDDNLAAIKVVAKMHKGDKDAETKKVDRMIRLFSPEWVMQTLGVVPVEDVNIFLESTKNAIEAFDTRFHAQMRSHKSFWGQHPEMIIMIAGLITLGVFMTIILNATVNYLGNMNGQSQSFINFLEAKIGGTSNTVTSTAVTTVPVTTALQGNTPT